jgi:hypothetical protein
METMHVRRRTAGLMLAVAAAAGLTTAAALPASASAAGYYEILVQASTFAPTRCLQPADPAGGAGTAVVQQPCVSSQAQHWAPISGGGSTYRFLNQATGLCLDVRGGAVAGTPIDLWPCNTISNERWSWPHDFPDGLWPIGSQVAGTSRFCLDVPGDSTQAGLGVQIYWCNNTRAQAWAISGPVA